MAQQSDTSAVPADPPEPFEAALARLEGLSARLEDPATGLDDAIGLYEQGVALAAECMQRLEAAEQRITTLKLRLESPQNDD